MRAWLMLVALGGLVLAPAAAQAQNEPVRIFNRATVPATQLFVVRTGHTAWSANLLREPLPPGRFLSVRLGEGAGCRFDLRMVLQDGQEIRRQDADVCATRSVELTPPPPPPAPAAAAAPDAAPDATPADGGAPARP